MTLIWLPLGLTEASYCLFDRVKEPQQAILKEKQFEWACKLGVVELVWISKVGHTVLARLIES